MFFFRLVEAVIIFLILVTLITQVVIPAFKRQAMFPYFRNRRKLEEEEVVLNQEIADEELRKRNEAKKSNLEKERNIRNG